MILLIDNYDSFSYNPYQLVGSINPDIRVIRNDAMTVDEISEMSPNAIIISPGPGRPEDAGVCIDVVRRLGPEIPILGVCLGHQAVCAAFGATISYAGHLMHGKQSDVGLELSCPIFRGCSPITPVARYHSLAAIDKTMPECLMITARSDDGEIMAVKHRNYDIYDIQFHPESFMTPEGEKMMRNFIEIAGT